MTPALDLEEEKITKLAQAVGDRKKPMVLGLHEEEGQFFPELASSNSTGFRAISAAALKPLLARDPLWVRTLPSNLAVDAALNMLVYPSGSPPLADVELLHSPPGRHLGLDSQGKEVREAFDRLNDEDFLQKKLNDPASRDDLSWTKALAFREHIVRDLLKKKA